MSDFENYLFEKFIKNHKRLKKLISLTGYCKQDDMYWGSSDNYEQYVSYEVWKYQQARVDELKTQLAVYKEDMQKDAEKISELENRIHDAELQIAVHWGADEDTDSVLRDVENALRGANA